MKDCKKNNAKRSMVLGGMLATAFMFGGNAMAQERENVSNTDVDTFQQWDANADERLDKVEYNKQIGNTGMYQNWQNQEGTLTQEDFNRGVFNRWDADGDGQLSEDEYASGNSAWSSSYGENFIGWDANQDSMLDEDEYMQGMNEAGVYNDWDADGDGTVNEDEFNEGVYNTWDSNRDGMLSRDEYDNANSDAWTNKPAGSVNPDGNE